MTTYNKIAKSIKTYCAEFGQDGIRLCLLALCRYCSDKSAQADNIGQRKYWDTLWDIVARAYKEVDSTYIETYKNE